MPEIHLRQSGFTYSACGTFTKNKERIQKFKETGDSWYIYQNELDKICFQHYMANKDFKDLKLDSRIGWPNNILNVLENYLISLLFNLYFQKKRAQNLSICHLPTKRSVWVFDVTNRTNGFKVIIK